MLYSHRRVSPIWNPICGQSGPRFPFPAKSRIGDSLFPDSGHIGNRGFPPPGRFPAKSGIGGTGIGDFRVRVWWWLATRSWAAAFSHGSHLSSDKASDRRCRIIVD
jgi:hypothetical protein